MSPTLFFDDVPWVKRDIILFLSSIILIRTSGLVRFILISTQFSVFVRDHLDYQATHLRSWSLERSDEEAKLSAKLCFSPCSRNTRLAATLIQKDSSFEIDVLLEEWPTTAGGESAETGMSKLDNENVELEFQVLNYARENAYLKATYKNLFNSISVSQTQTKTIIAFLQNELQSTIYKNTKLRTQLSKKVSEQKDNTHDTSANTKFAKQPIVENLPKVGETNALSKPVTSNSVSTLQEPKVVKNVKVIALGMFRINPNKTFREEKNVPNTVRASNRTKPITVSQPSVFTKKYVNSDLNGLSSTE
nr:hypothetical protein [Tanacetum cinerariifolium]